MKKCRHTDVAISTRTNTHEWGTCQTCGTKVIKQRVDMVWKPR